MEPITGPFVKLYVNDLEFIALKFFFQDELSLYFPPVNRGSLLTSLFSVSLRLIIFITFFLLTYLRISAFALLRVYDILRR